MSSNTSASTRNSDFVLCRLCMQTSVVCLSKQFITSVTLLCRDLCQVSNGQDYGLGLDNSPYETKIKFSFMASLHMFLLDLVAIYSQPRVQILTVSTIKKNSAGIRTKSPRTKSPRTKSPGQNPPGQNPP